MCYNQSRLLRDDDDDDIIVSMGGQLTCTFNNCYKAFLQLCRWVTWIQLEEKEKPKLKKLKCTTNLCLKMFLF